VLVKADDQPIISRPFHDSVWLTSFITPQNPDVLLKYQELIEGIQNSRDRVIALWQYVANMRYQPTVSARVSLNGNVIAEPDTWLFPSETMQVNVANCANRSFLLASLLKNELTLPDQVYCSLGYLNLDGVGAHAWVIADISGEEYILETTQPRLESAFVPASVALAYDQVIAFDEKSVYTVGVESNIASILNASFGLCAIEFLRDYLCERCLGLEV